MGVEPAGPGLPKREGPGRAQSQHFPAAAPCRAMMLNVNEPETRGVALALQITLDDLGKGARPPACLPACGEAPRYDCITGRVQQCSNCDAPPLAPPPLQAWALRWSARSSPTWAAPRRSTSRRRAGSPAACSSRARRSRWRGTRRRCSAGCARPSAHTPSSRGGSPGRTRRQRARRLRPGAAERRRRGAPGSRRPPPERRACALKLFP